MKLRELLKFGKPRPAERISIRSTPWLTDQAVDAIDDFISQKPRLNVLELGSGASTLWFASKGVQITSFEDNAAWQDAVFESAIEQGLEMPDLRRYPLPYYQHIDRLPDGFYDIVLVDGRDRVECTRRARHKLATGGLFVVDNTERMVGGGCPAPYAEIASLLSDLNRADHEQFGPDRTGWQAKHSKYAGRWITSIWR